MSLPLSPNPIPAPAPPARTSPLVVLALALLVAAQGWVIYRAEFAPPAPAPGPAEVDFAALASKASAATRNAEAAAWADFGSKVSAGGKFSDLVTALEQAIDAGRKSARTPVWGALKALVPDATEPDVIQRAEVAKAAGDIARGIKK